MIPKDEKVNCRSRKSQSCSHGRPSADIYDPDGDGMFEDGTWDGESVVCDACYIAVGMPSMPFGSPGSANFGSTIEGGKGPCEEQRMADKLNSEFGR